MLSAIFGIFLFDIFVVREDLAERKPLLGKRATGHMLGLLRTTLHNSKKILDPRKSMCPPEFQPNLRPSQSLNYLQVIKSEPPAPNPWQPDVRGKMEQLSIQQSHMAGSKGDSSPEKVGEQLLVAFCTDL